MFVAVCDQSTGASTSRCSKITEPLSFPMEAVIRSLPGLQTRGKKAREFYPGLAFCGRSFGFQRLHFRTQIYRELAHGIASWFCVTNAIVPQRIGVRQELYLYAVS